MATTESTDELQLVARNSDLEPTKVEALLSNFGTSYNLAKELAAGAEDILVTDESDTGLMQEARRKRLALKNVRVEVENTRKVLKEQSLREGKAIDGMSNIIKALIVPVEEHLEKQEKFAELRQAERRATRLAERVVQMSKYVSDTGLYNLTDMSDEAFAELLDTSRAAHEALVSAQVKAEAERVEAAKAEAAEQQRIREENARFKAEASTRAKEEAERVAAEAKTRREAQKAPDADKLLILAAQIAAIPMPDVSSAPTAYVVQEAGRQLAELAASIRKEAEAL